MVQQIPTLGRSFIIVLTIAQLSLDGRLHLVNEIQAFIDLVQQCAEHGPPAANLKNTPRQANTRFQMNLDDGVMVNQQCCPLVLTRTPMEQAQNLVVITIEEENSDALRSEFEAEYP